MKLHLLLALALALSISAAACRDKQKTVELEERERAAEVQDANALRGRASIPLTSLADAGPDALPQDALLDSVGHDIDAAAAAGAAADESQGQASK